MNEETDIEILPPEIAEVKVTPRRRLNSLAFIGVAFLASAFGAILAFFASDMMKKPDPSLAPLKTSFETLSAENKTLKAQIARLQRDIKALPKSLPKSLPETETVDLSDIESRLARLETAEPQAIDPELVARLEALKEEGSEALDLSEILARLEALESRPVTLAASPVATAVVTSNFVPEVSFPKAKVLAALDEAAAQQGWLKKSLKKHISVQSEDNPYYLLEIVVTQIDAGNTEAAIAAFDKLPAEAKAAATQWRESVESN